LISTNKTEPATKNEEEKKKKKNSVERCACVCMKVVLK